MCVANEHGTGAIEHIPMVLAGIDVRADKSKLVAMVVQNVHSTKRLSNHVEIFVISKHFHLEAIGQATALLRTPASVCRRLIPLAHYC